MNMNVLKIRLEHYSVQHFKSSSLKDQKRCVKCLKCIISNHRDIIQEITAMPLFTKVYSHSNPLKSLSLFLETLRLPIIVTLLSVQSKLSFTVCPQSAHRPNVFTVHFTSSQHRKLTQHFTTEQGQRALMTMTTSSGVWAMASCWHPTQDEGLGRTIPGLESGLCWSPGTRQRPRTPGWGTGRSSLYSSLSTWARAGPYLAMGT